MPAHARSTKWRPTATSGRDNDAVAQIILYTIRGKNNVDTVTWCLREVVLQAGSQTSRFGSDKMGCSQDTWQDISCIELVPWTSYLPLSRREIRSHSIVFKAVQGQRGLLTNADLLVSWKFTYAGISACARHLLRKQLALHDKRAPGPEIEWDTTSLHHFHVIHQAKHRSKTHPAPARPNKSAPFKHTESRLLRERCRECRTRTRGQVQKNLLIQMLLSGHCRAVCRSKICSQQQGL